MMEFISLPASLKIKVITRLNNANNIVGSKSFANISNFAFSCSFLLAGPTQQIYWTVSGQSVVINYKQTELALADWNEKLL